MSGGGGSVIVCEGFHDRAMWQAILLHLRCNENRGVSPTKGRFRYLSPTQKLVEVVPKTNNLEGKNTIAERCAIELSGSPGRIVACYDTDERIPGPGNRDGVLSSIRDYMLRRGDKCTCSEIADRRFRMNDEVDVIAVDWSTIDRERHPGVPDTQTLERVVCLAFAKTYPARARHVELWLGSRPEPPSPTESSAKEYPFSYLAGWHSKATSYESFIRQIWEVEQVKQQLIEILEGAGVLAIAREIVA